MSISDSKQDAMEEIFSRLVIEGLSSPFTISKEESYDTGEWIYRIYNYSEDLHKKIEEHTYNNLRDIMQKVSFVFNTGDDLSARIHLQKLVKFWKETWDETGRN